MKISNIETIIKNVGGKCTLDIDDTYLAILPSFGCFSIMRASKNNYKFESNETPARWKTLTFGSLSQLKIFLQNICSQYCALGGDCQKLNKKKEKV